MTLGRHVGWMSHNMRIQVHVSRLTHVSDLGSEVQSEQDVESSEVTMDEVRGQRVEIVKALNWIHHTEVRMKPLHY